MQSAATAAAAVIGWVLAALQAVLCQGVGSIAVILIIGFLIVICV